ncbi:MSMEG_0569 family flavin-dependent oxidoreductase [Labrys monachus]|uniref:Flavoprotein involved in K+ transport n=1 Tax=Labrys monachus TaxID=217067 RepID=A0ABU0FBV1_9HYPH|nr:MSMEG_0569 family flavin-dependent oxidoreductase [Labrys monachus]MDQ0392090.1 putative flavoprotein involved in K+ transport [Labrys monachus]
MRAPSLPHHPAVVVGGGQAGLSASHHLKRHGIDHVVFERNRIAHAWRSQRWDAFCLVTPNWQCQLPDFPYAGPEPHGFMPRDEIVAYVEAFARHIDAPLREGVAVERVSRRNGVFLVETSEGAVTADAVILAVSAYHLPNTPRMSESVPDAIVQIHSSAYRNPQQLPEGAVLVVGSGQSGCQIAEDLHLAGRKVHLVVGSAPRCPRFYRGRDAVDWLDDLGQYDMTVEQHPLGEKVRRNANHYLTGRDGGRDIDLRRFAAEGMVLHGRLTGIDDGSLTLADDLARNLDAADAVYNGICGLIDRHIADNAIAAPEGTHYEPVWQPGEPARRLDLAASGIGSIVWSTGFRSDWSWVDLPLLDENGYPSHRRGVTGVDGVYVVGMPWLWTWGSGRFLSVGRDAGFVVDHLAARGRDRAAPVPARLAV